MVENFASIPLSQKRGDLLIWHHCTGDEIDADHARGLDKGNTNAVNFIFGTPDCNIKYDIYINHTHTHTHPK
jgi:hypothetical protein